MSLVVTSQHREADLWPVWAALAFGLTCGAGIVFALGAQQWRALPEAERRSRREAAVIVGTVVLGAALYGAVAASSNDRPGAWRGLCSWALPWLEQRRWCALPTRYGRQRALIEATWPQAS